MSAPPLVPRSSGDLLCCGKLSSAGGMRGQLEVGQELGQTEASPLPAIALPFSLRPE